MRGVGGFLVIVVGEVVRARFDFVVVNYACVFSSNVWYIA